MFSSTLIKNTNFSKVKSWQIHKKHTDQTWLEIGLPEIAWYAVFNTTGSEIHVPFHRFWVNVYYVLIYLNWPLDVTLTLPKWSFPCIISGSVSTAYEKASLSIRVISSHFHLFWLFIWYVMNTSNGNRYSLLYVCTVSVCVMLAYFNNCFVYEFCFAFSRKMPDFKSC